MSHPLHIAVFGDTHGHLRLMFQLCRLWQLGHGVHLDLVLQCGDLGFYPDAGAVDKATRQYAKRDPEELGFSRFFSRTGLLERDPLLEETLNGPPDDLGTVRCPVLWCHGNHEDFAALRELVGSRDLVPVDAFSRLLFAQPGAVVEVVGDSSAEASSGLERRLTLRGRSSTQVFPRGAEFFNADGGGSESLAIAAVGGGPEPREAIGNGTDHDPFKLVDPRWCSRLEGAAVDVLMSHCAALGAGGEASRWGSSAIAGLLRSAQPSYHFYSHHTTPIPPARFGATDSIWLADVNFVRAQKGMFPYAGLEPGCMGLLRWAGRDDHDFVVVDEPWLEAVQWSTWRKL